MKWQGGRRNGNVEDRRGMSGGQKIAFGGIGGIIVLLIGLFMGGDPAQLLQQLQQGGELDSSESAVVESTPEEDRLLDFSRVVLTSTDEIGRASCRERGSSAGGGEEV